MLEISQIRSSCDPRENMETSNDINGTVKSTIVFPDITLMTNSSDSASNETNYSMVTNSADIQFVQELSTIPPNLYHGFYITMIILAILGFIANLSSLLATAHIPQGQTTHSKLIMSLAVSDMLIVISVFIYAVDKIYPSEVEIIQVLDTKEPNHMCKEVAISMLKNIAFLTMLFNLMAMAVDHNIAIIKPLHYVRLMSKSRGNIIIALVWATALFTELSNFWIGAAGYDKNGTWTYCEHVLYDIYENDYIILSLTFLCFIIIVAVYTRIYVEIKRMYTRFQEIRQDNMHNQKAMVTTILIIGTFVLCFLPNTIFQIAMHIQVEINSDFVFRYLNEFDKINMYMFILQIVNSICDPLIYAVRLKEVQAGYRTLTRRCVCCVPSHIFYHKHINNSMDLSHRRNTVRSLLTSEEEDMRHATTTLVNTAGGDPETV